MKILDISIGSLVTHKSHNLGVGVVTEIRTDVPTGAYRCLWAKAPYMTLFICGSSLNSLS